MLVTLEGIVTLVRELQWANAASPMLVTLEGIVTLVREEHWLNALFPIRVTDLPPRVEGIVSAPTGYGETAVLPNPSGSSGSSS